MSLQQATELFEGFRGRAPDRYTRVTLPDHDAGMLMGKVTGIMYDTERDGEKEKYFHKFKPWASPWLVASSDGRRLIPVGGQFQVTDRGIEDKKDMAVLAIANPSKRGAAKKRVSLNHPAFMRVPAAPKRKAAKAAQPIIVMSNPAPKKRRRTSHALSVPKMQMKEIRSRRHNPIKATRAFFSTKKGSLDFTKMIVPSIYMGAGAVGATIFKGMLKPYLPAYLTSGPFAPLMDITFGMGMGWVVAKFVNKNVGAGIAEGAMTIAVYNLVKSLVPSSVQMGDYPVYNSAMGGFVANPNLNGFVDNPNLGAYTASYVYDDQDSLSPMLTD